MVRTITLAVAVTATVAASAQDEPRASSSRYLPAFKKADVSMAFDIGAEGRRFEPTWGLDLAWINEQNLRKGVNHMLKENVGIGRSSFRVFNPLKGDTALTSDQIAGLRERSNLFNTVVAPTLPLVLNCDNGYRPSGHTGSNINTYYTTNKRANKEHWAAAIAAHVAWMQKNTKHPVAGVSPFNEPDLDTDDLAQGTAADERDVARVLKQNYKDVLGEAVIAGGNTLNNDKALSWYNTGKQFYDWGNTHQLAGSFDNFARFFQQVAKDGKVGYDDEMHNTVEAMVGLEYGMSVGIWWGFDSRTRGEFCQISRNGVRLAYGEHRDNWTAASVWRHDDGRVKAFIGSSERQAATTSYQFVSKDRDVYYDGYGPVREFRMEIPGGTGYQKGQTNAERVIDVTWGDDVPPAVIDGTYKIVCKQTGNVVAWTSTGSGVLQQKFADGNKKQQWTVKPCSSRTGGDFSFYDIASVADERVHINVKNYSTASGGETIAWAQDAPTSNEQWYLEYAGNGYYYLRCRESALYLAASGTTATARLVQTTMLPENARSRMMFRFLPLDVDYDTQAPAAPNGLTATPHAASVTLTWNASADADLEGYMVVRAQAGTDDWNTIARKLTTTTYTDNTCRPGIAYVYKVKAIDRAQNLSEPSATAEAAPTAERSMTARWQMEGNTQDDTENMMDAALAAAANYVDGRTEGTKALRLNGSTQYVQLPYEIADADELTVAMWVKMRSSNTWQRLLDFGNDTEHYMFLTPKNSYTNVMRFAIKNGADEQTLDCKTALPSGQWKHVVLTIGTGRTAIYVDGEEAASTTAISISPSDIRPVLNFIGRSQFAADPLMSADIDDVRIYNYALTADDVKTLMDGGELTAVESLNADRQPAVIYGIDGIRRPELRRGLNIIDGKKVVR
ncbi:MAG: RICIN domain-containing protein [Prevotella sp.]|nr:RICIN domain-containing protein [Prevotella sp.]